MSKIEHTPFRRALVDGVLEEFGDVPAEDRIELTFSETFLAAGERLAGESQCGKTGGIGKTLGRVILIAAVLTALAGTVMASVGSGTMMGGGAEKERTHYENTMPKYVAPAETIGKVYLPTDIPFRYHYVYEPVLVLDHVVFAGWHEWEGERMITFKQYPMHNTTIGVADEYEVVQINGFDVIVSKTGREERYSWNDGEYYFILTFNRDVTEEERYQIFDSIALARDKVTAEHLNVRSVESTPVVDQAGNLDIHVQVEGWPELENSQVTVFLQKKAGFHWERVDLDLENDQWTCSADGQALDIHFQTRLEEKGEYRVVAKYVFTGTVQQAVVRFAQFEY